MFAAGAQAQAKAGLVHYNVGNNEQYDGHRGGQVEILENQVIPEAGAVHRGKAEGFAGDAHPVGDKDGGQALALNGPGHNHGEGGRKLVQRRAADGLVSLQVDGRKAQQQGENHTGAARNKDSDKHRQLRMRRAKAVLVKGLQREAGEQCADNHHAFQRNVDNAGMFAEHTAHCDKQQRHGEQDCHTDNVGSNHHFAAPPFSLRPETSLAITPRISSAKAAR